MPAGALFGRVPKTPDDRDFLLAPHVKPLPHIPDDHWGHGNTYSNWRMNGNGPLQPGEHLPRSWVAAREGAGDCVYAAWLNELKVALTDSGITTTEAERLVGNAEQAIGLYHKAEGYDPRTGANDNGAEIRNRLKYAQKKGLKDADGHVHKGGIYALVDHTNLEHVLFAMRYFEALPIGCEVLESNMDAFDEAEAKGEAGNAVWDSDDTGLLGLHCIPLVGRPDGEKIAALTWQRRILLTEAFLAERTEEVWAYLSPDRISKVTGKSYEGASEELLDEYLTLAAKD